MNFASLRIGKIDQGTETAAHNHNMRASLTKEEINVNRELTHQNKLLMGRSDTVKAINEKIESLNLKTAVRKDANRAIEFVLSASPEYFYDFEKAGITREDWDKITIENLGEKKYWERLAEIKKFTIHENVEKWKKDIVSWVNADPDLKNNVINLVVHQDEKTIHAHLIVTPVIDGKLTAKQFFTPGRTKYWQDTYAKATGLKRGIASDVQHKTKTDYDVKQAMKKGYRNGKKKGFDEGYQAGIAEAQKLGTKAGAIFGGLKTSWHEPSAKAVAKATQVKAEAQKAQEEAKKAQEEAEKVKTKAKKEADERVANVANQLTEERTKTKDLTQELKKEQDRANDLAERLALYEKNQLSNGQKFKK
jgi:hypothetical protein